MILVADWMVEQPLVRLYKVPDDTFDADAEEEEEEQDEE